MKSFNDYMDEVERKSPELASDYRTVKGSFLIALLNMIDDLAEKVKKLEEKLKKTTCSKKKL